MRRADPDVTCKIPCQRGDAAASVRICAYFLHRRRALCDEGDVRDGTGDVRHAERKPVELSFELRNRARHADRGAGRFGNGVHRRGAALAKIVAAADGPSTSACVAVYACTVESDAFMMPGFSLNTWITGDAEFVVHEPLDVIGTILKLSSFTPTSTVCPLRHLRPSPAP